jgi:rhomboid family GlyGly-CTERM serine protease
MLPVALAVIALAAMIGGDDARYWLSYERHAILDGQIWRVVTGHLTHLGWQHLLLNLAGLFLLWIIFGRLLSLARWAVALLCCALGVSLGLLAFHPELDWYVGLSGVLHGMFVIGAVAGIRSGYRAEWLLLALLAMKLAWEQLRGATPATAELVGGNVIVDAHLYGAITGLLVALALRWLDRGRPAPARA